MNFIIILFKKQISSFRPSTKELAKNCISRVESSLKSRAVAGPVLNLNIYESSFLFAKAIVPFCSLTKSSTISTWKIHCYSSRKEFHFNPNSRSCFLISNDGLSAKVTIIASPFSLLSLLKVAPPICSYSFKVL